MAKATKSAGKAPEKLGRSALTGKFVLRPAGKAGGSVSTTKMREMVRTVLAENKR